MLLFELKKTFVGDWLGFLFFLDIFEKEKAQNLLSIHTTY